ESVGNLYIDSGNSVAVSSSGSTSSMLSIGNNLSSALDANSFALKGELRLNASGTAAANLVFGGNTQIGGGGDIKLNSPATAGAAGAVINLSSWTITNINGLIQGAGTIESGNLVNQTLGTINANGTSPGSTSLTIGGVALTNQGVLEASNGAALLL